MNMPTYVGLMLTLIVIGIYYIIKYRRVKVPWKILMYFLVVNSIVLMINRIIEEYQSNTHLEKISSNVALISSGIFIASIFVVGIITKMKENVKAILFAYTYYLSAHFRRLLAIFVLICNIFINHSAKKPLLSKRK